MRIKLLLTGVLIAIASVGIAYYLLSNNAAISDETIQPLLNSTLNLNSKNTPLNKEYSDQRIAQLSQKVDDLEDRIKRTESLLSKQAKILALADTSKYLVNKQKTQPKQLSETDFSHWLDETLSAGHFDADETQMILAKAEKSLAVLPGVSVEGMECGKSFCRAKFTSEKGKPLNVAEVFGASPFMGSGFTVNEPDGSVKVYFTQVGQSIDELREEAVKTVLGQ